MAHVIVGTAGHIDHGKSALVRLLTGTDPDRFKEEKERGITIDIGFADLELHGGLHIGFVDVPGHERFIKNMLAGIGGIDAVMLVVAADESVMPQTREHLEICSLLHVAHGLTVITKTDTVDEELVDLVELEVRDYLKTTFLAEAPLVRVSARTGAGREELIQALDDVARSIPSRDSRQSFRLPIDRSFTMRGFGTVVTGTLISGAVHKGDSVELLPPGRTYRVRGLQVHGQAVERAVAGQRTGVNLQGLEVRDAERGMVLAEPGLLRPASMLDCHMELLKSAPRPILRRKRIRFHAGTSEIMGYVVLLGADRLESGEDAFVQIRLENETVVLPGDRFILRQYSPMLTIGGGEVLEVNPRRHRLKDPRVIERLRVIKDASVEDHLQLLIEEAGLAARTLDELAAKTGLAARALKSHLDRMIESGLLRAVSDAPLSLVLESSFLSAVEATFEEVAGYHRSHPLASGVSREELKKLALPEASDSVFKAALDTLIAEERIQTSHELVHVSGRSVRLTPEEQRVQEALQSEFRGLGCQVLAPDEVIRKLGLDPVVAPKIMALMVREGRLVKVSEDLIMDRGAVDRIVQQLRDRKRIDPKLDVGSFKEISGVSRKYAIPLLEYLDRQRVTRRVGNDRMIL